MPLPRPKRSGTPKASKNSRFHESAWNIKQTLKKAALERRPLIYKRDWIFMGVGYLTMVFKPLPQDVVVGVEAECLAEGVHAHPYLQVPQQEPSTFGVGVLLDA
jgi:hypothetical protein